MSDESNELEKRFKNYDPKLHFTVVSQKLAQDKRLSWGARGLFVYLASNRHDYTFHESVIFRHASNGRRSTRRALHELIHYGYLKRKQHINKKTRRFGQTTWSLYYVPNDRQSAHHKYLKKRVDGSSSNGIRHNGSSSNGNRSSNKYQPNKYQSNKYQDNKYLSRDGDGDRTDRVSEYENHILNDFNDLFHERPVSKFKQYVNKELEKSSDYGVTRDHLSTAMKTTKSHCNSRNPYKIASYIVQCVKYPQQRKGTENKYYSNVLNMLNRNFQKVNVDDSKVRSAVKELLKSHSYSAICTAISDVNTYEVYNNRAEAHPVRYIKKSLNGEDWIHE